MKNLVIALAAVIGTAFVSNAQDVNESKVVKKKPQVVHINQRIDRDNVLVREAHPIKANVEDKRHLHTPDGKPYKKVHKHEVKHRQRHQVHAKKAVK